MTRPTVEGLAHATDCLEQLAWNCTTKNENGFHQIAELLDIALWLDTEAEHHRMNAAYGPGSEQSPEGGGTIASHTIDRHGLNRPTEERLEWGAEEGRGQRGGPMQPPVEPRDLAYRDLRRLQRDLVSTLTSVAASSRHKADEKGGYPRRSEAG